MNPITFSRLFQKDHGFSRQVLIELNHPDISPRQWLFTNNKTDVNWQGKTYISVPVSYKFPSSRDGVPQGGTLEIDIDIQHGNTELLKWFDEADHMAYINVVGVINERGEITPVSQITQRHGNVTWDGEKIVWQLGADDRMNMQVNAWVFTPDALMG